MLNYQKTVGVVAAAALLGTTGAASAFPLGGPARPQAAVRDFGPVDPARSSSITVHLKLPNQALWSRTVDALYDPHSPTFHHWLSDAQIRQFAPPPAQLAAVRAELQRNGLSTSTASDGFSIQARGSIAAIERTFHTEIHQFVRNGKPFQANTRPPALSGAANAFVSVVSGLERHTVTPTLARAIDPVTRKPLAAVPLGGALASRGLSSLISDDILGPKEILTFKAKGGLPSATYAGLTYNPISSKTADFTPQQLEQIYGLPAVYGQGISGAGQTIVLLEGYGYPTALADANAFSNATDLPDLNGSTFSVVYPEGAPNPNAGILSGWDGEIALDIQWSHSIAPKAKILIVASNGQDDQDFEQAMQYIIDNASKLGAYTVSDSWEEDQDFFAGPAEQIAFEDVLTTAAAKGISFQFSTGDGGDDGLGTPAGAAGVPSDAPHATAVGGTSIVNDPGTATFVSLAWGGDFAYIDQDGPLDPPTQNEFFFGGGGGGESLYFAKPAWQKALPGTGRQTPDISALADPYTGVPIVLTNPSTGQHQVLVGIGGTSLASPIFTALWALADQKAKHPLGLAAPAIAALKTGVTDVLPPAIGSDFAASVTDSKGTTKYTAAQLFAPLGFSQKTFLPVLYNLPAIDTALVFAIGADSSLTAGTGWDNATGYGTPGAGFIDAAAAQ